MEDSPFKPDVVQDKVVLITGGGTGIGYGIAECFGRHGAKVSIMGRRRQVLDDAVAQLSAIGITAMAVVGDVRDSGLCAAAVDETVRSYGRLDVLVNNAAGNFMAS